MADYIYLLENRLSSGQRSALRTVRDLARSKGLTVFLVGGAVRDLTSGSPVRDLDVVVQGNALKLKKDLERLGAIVVGEQDSAQALHLQFPGNIRLEIASTLSVTFPKPGKAVSKPATILEDLRRRDFTANAMALSLNEGSYGLLMDPLNGVADIENRQLRLVSNYGFIEDPVRMVRAARLMARLGWTLDERTQTRYENGQAEGYISAMPEYHRGYELEEIAHEEDPLRVLRRLEAEGWMKHLAPYWTAAKVNVAELERLRESQSQMEMQGIHPDTAAANFPLLTAKLTPKEVATLKASFPRGGFVQQIEGLEAQAKELASVLSGKSTAQASQAWKAIMAAKPEAVLWVAYSSKNAALQAKFKSFYTEWPLARQKMPYTMMQEMRIVPELPGYDDLLEKLFFELMDGRLTTPEEMKAFLEPFSPPAPPPPVNMRRPRATKRESKPVKARAKKSVKAEEPQENTGIAASAADIEALAAVVAPAASEPPQPATKVPAKALAHAPAAAKAPAKKAEAKPAAAPTKPASKSVAEGKGAAKKAVSASQAAAKKKASSSASPAKSLPAKKATAAPKKASRLPKPAVAAKKAVTKPTPAKKSPQKTAKKSAATKPATPKKAPSKSPAKKTLSAGKSKPAGASKGAAASSKAKNAPAKKKARK